MINRETEKYIKYLAKEAEAIMENPEEVYDLAGKRLALLSALYRDHFSKPENTFRIAVVGNRNLGKTTYSYSISKILETYKIPAHYIDLDPYSQSGPAMAGEIKWENRRKRDSDEVSKKEIEESIKQFSEASPGIILGDFPGRIDNIYQTARLKVAGLALIFSSNLANRNQWIELCQQVNLGFRWVVSKPELSLEAPIYPQVTDLNRKIIFSTPLIVSAASILEEALARKNISSKQYQHFFTQPELVVLEEHLDFLFSIIP